MAMLTLSSLETRTLEDQLKKTCRVYSIYTCYSIAHQVFNEVELPTMTPVVIHVDNNGFISNSLNNKNH